MSRLEGLRASLARTATRSGSAPARHLPRAAQGPPRRHALPASRRHGPRRRRPPDPGPRHARREPRLRLPRRRRRLRPRGPRRDPPPPERPRRAARPARGLLHRLPEERPRPRRADRGDRDRATSRRLSLLVAEGRNAPGAGHLEGRPRGRRRRRERPLHAPRPRHGLRRADGRVPAGDARPRPLAPARGDHPRRRRARRPRGHLPDRRHPLDRRLPAARRRRARHEVLREARLAGSLTKGGVWSTLYTLRCLGPSRRASSECRDEPRDDRGERRAAHEEPQDHALGEWTHAHPPQDVARQARPDQEERQDERLARHRNQDAPERLKGRQERPHAGGRDEAGDEERELHPLVGAREERRHPGRTA